jgi:hypothetical protein
MWGAGSVPGENKVEDEIWPVLRIKLERGKNRKKYTIDLV